MMCDSTPKAKVAFCVPYLENPKKEFVASFEASTPILENAGYETVVVVEVGNPYISAARSIMLRKALDAKADVIVFLDYDLSWEPGDLLKLIEAEGDVVAGTYRFKTDDEKYMGVLETTHDGRPIGRADGCLKATRIPAGFMKITADAVNRYMLAYPELVYGPVFNASVDLFAHGIFDRVWHGEDYSFSRRWIEMGQSIWLIPTLKLTHHGAKPFAGDYHDFLMRQPGGALAP